MSWSIHLKGVYCRKNTISVNDLKTNFVKYYLFKQTLSEQLYMSGNLHACTNKTTLLGTDITSMLMHQESQSIHSHKWYLIKLQTPMRKNQCGYRSWPTVFKKSRRRIEIMFSQFSKQNLLKRYYLLSFSGLLARIIAKVASATILQYLNYKIIAT